MPPTRHPLVAPQIHRQGLPFASNPSPRAQADLGRVPAPPISPVLPRKGTNAVQHPGVTSGPRLGSSRACPRCPRTEGARYNERDADASVSAPGAYTDRPAEPQGMSLELDPDTSLEDLLFLISSKTNERRQEENDRNTKGSPVVILPGPCPGPSVGPRNPYQRRSLALPCYTAPPQLHLDHPCRENPGQVRCP